MEPHRIVSAAQRIETATAALEWLYEFGQSLDGRDKERASVTVHLKTGSAVYGAKEAQEQLTAYARFALPEIVKMAISGCTNDIALSRAAIEEELAK